MSGKRELLRANALFAALLAAYFLPALLPGKVQTPVDLLYHHLPWSASPPAGFSFPSNQLLSDQAIYLAPNLQFTCEMLRAGEVPLWNPHVACGVPHWANPETRTLSPWTWLHAALPFWQGFAWEGMLRLLLAANGMYFLSRRIGIGFMGAVLAGVVFIFSSFQIVWLHHGLASVSIYLPWLLWSAERICRAVTLRAALPLAAWSALAWVGGHPETALHACLLSGVYALLRGNLSGKGGRVALLGPVAAGLGLGAMLAAPLLAPFSLVLRDSVVWNLRAGERLLPYFDFERDVRGPRFLLDLGTEGRLFARDGWWRLATAFVPGLYGDPRQGTHWAPVNYGAICAYAGAAPLLLWLWGGLAGVPFARPVRILGWFGAAGLAVFALVPPILSLSLAIPGLGWTATSRLVLAWQVAVAVGAGAALEAILRGEGRRPARTAWLAAAAGALAVGSCALCISFLQSAGAGETSADLLGPACGPLRRFAAAWAGGIALLLLVGRRSSWARAAGWGLVLLCFADLARWGRTWNPVVPAEWALREPPSARFLRARGVGEGERMAGLRPDEWTWHAPLTPNAGLFHGLSDYGSGGGSCLSRRYRDFHRELVGGKGRHYHLFSPVGWEGAKGLGLAGVRYLVETWTGWAKGFPAVYRGEVVIRENPFAVPRAYVVHRAILASDAAEARKKAAEIADPLEEAVVEGLDRAFPDAPAVGGRPLARVFRRGVNDVEVEIRTDRPGLLVLAEAYEPGWSATVDGRPARIHPVNGLVRGVQVPAGISRVRFRYWPRGLTEGICLAAAGLLICLRLARGG